jgi:cyanophycinase
MQRFFLLALICFLSDRCLYGQVFDERFDIWPVNLKSPGTVGFGASITAEQLEAISPAKNAARVVLVSNNTGPNLDAIKARYLAYCPTLQTLTPSEWMDSQSKEGHADVCIWHDDLEPKRWEQADAVRFRNALAAHLKAEKTLFAISEASKQVARYFVTNVANGLPQIAEGLDLVPDCVVAPQFEHTVAGKGQLLSILSAHPRCVGVGLESGTVAILRGRKIRVVGTGTATFLIASNERQPFRSHTLVERASSSRDPERSLLDLTEWRRDAIDRTLEEFPPEKTERPHVASGKLFIVGGGGMPQGLMTQFIEAAGGIENAKLVYVPCEEREQVDPDSGMITTWKKMGVKQCALVHTKDRIQANEDEAFLKPLSEATGIWFGGGRQWNLADSYYGTKAHRLMKEVLHRGGVVGGSSAGASIQAAYLARATPIENFRIMAPGYERGGLGFLRGVAIDQHFTQRKRQPDMTQLVNRYPQLLGIGLDEATALIVEGSVASVHGNGKAHFYDRTKPNCPDQPDFLALSHGQRYDLAERKLLDDKADTADTAR